MLPSSARLYRVPVENTASEDMNEGNNYAKDGEIIKACRAYYSASGKYYHERDYINAINAYSEIITLIKLNPKNFKEKEVGDIYNKRGKIYETLKMLDEAAADYTQSKNLGNESAKISLYKIYKKAAFPMLWGLSVFADNKKIKIPRVLRNEILKKAGLDDIQGCINDSEETQKLIDDFTTIEDTQKNNYKPGCVIF